MSGGRGLRFLLLAFLIAAVVAPALTTVAGSFEGEGGFSLEAYRGFLGGPDLHALLTTIAVALASVVVAGVPGVLVAVALHGRRSVGARALTGIALLPLAMPPLIGSIAIYLVFGETGILSRGLTLLFSLDGPGFILSPAAFILTVHALTMYPIFTLFTFAGLARMDPSLAEAARGLGASRARTFMTVTLPGLGPSLRGASRLVFLSSTASFSAPYLFAPELPILSVRIFFARQSGNLAGSLAQTTVLMGVALAAVLLMRPRGASPVAGGRERGVEGRAPRGAVVATALWVGLAVLPLVALFLVAFSVNGSWTTTWLPTAWTTANYTTAFRSGGLASDAALSSLWMASLATGALLFFGVLAGRVLRERRPLYEALIMLPWALPGTVVAVNLLQAGRPVGLAGTIWILPIAYAVRGLPLMARAAEAAFARVPTHLEEAARGLGETSRGAFFRVTLPLAGPGILAGGVLVFAFALGEYVASVLLYLPQNAPVSIAIQQSYRVGNLGSAAALGTMLVALIAAVFAVSARFARR